MQMREILPICRADSADLFPTGDELAMLDQDLIDASSRSIEILGKLGQSLGKAKKDNLD